MFKKIKRYFKFRKLKKDALTPSIYAMMNVQPMKAPIDANIFQCDFDAVDVSKFKNACVYRMSKHRMFNRPASNEILMSNMGYLCPDCRMNAVPFGGKTCTDMLMQYGKEL